MSSNDKDIKELIDSLNERNKELKCIYAVDELLKNVDKPIEEILESLLEIIPQGFRYSDICSIKINYEDVDFIGNGFKITELKLTRPISIEDTRKGEITVVYTKPFRAEKGVFLPEEQLLLNTISEKISQFIRYQNLRKSINNYNHQAKSDTSKHDNSAKLFQWLADNGLNQSEIEEFTKVKISFKKGETICKQGAYTSYIMILANGLSKNYLEGTQERGFNFSIVKPFDFIGLSSLFRSKQYYFSGSAITPCTIYMVNQERFREVIEQNQVFAGKVMEWYCRTTEGHLKRLSCLGNKQALGRIAEILLYLSEDVFDSTLIDNRVTRKDIAELAGMSTESAVRILSELKKDGIITITSSGIEASDPRLLKTISLAG